MYYLLEALKGYTSRMPVRIPGLVDVLDSVTAQITTASSQDDVDAIKRDNAYSVLEDARQPATVPAESKRDDLVAATLAAGEAVSKAVYS